jgi:glycosyltransferase involved in cell wall biosynthesis
MDISVIIPTYKPGSYIFHCLRSIAKQNIAKQRFEVIVILNGCKEPYLSSIRSFIEKELRHIHVSLVQTDVPGVSNARNIGLNNAKGDYIAFIDDDDWVSNNYLENLLIVSTSNSVTIANVLQIDESTHKESPHFLTKAYQNAIHRNNLTIFDTRSFLSAAGGKLIPKSIILDRRFNVRHTLGEDSLFMFEISDKIKEIKIAEPSTIYYVRNRADSVSRREHSFKQRLNVASNLLADYVMVYVPNAAKYDFRLFASRIAATMKNLFFSYKLIKNA